MMDDMKIESFLSCDLVWLFSEKEMSELLLGHTLFFLCPSLWGTPNPSL